jgi:hypothetical protein
MAGPQSPDAVPVRRFDRAERGFTAIEMTVTAILVGMATLVVERTVGSATETERLMRAVRGTHEDGPQVCYLLRDLVLRSRKLYGADAIGDGYLAKLDLSRDPLRAGSRLPKFDEVNPLGPDAAGSPHTGNVLLFMREGDPVPCVADKPSKKVRLIDTYRFVCVHLTPSSRTLVQGQPPALDLVVWRSGAYPNHGQIVSISDANERKEVVKDLYGRFGHSLLWDPTAAVDAAFYGIDGTGNVAATPTVLSTIPEDVAASSRGVFVPRNVAVARTDAASKPRMSLFTADDPATWVPDGFETKVVGTSGSRKVWMRLTVEQQSKPGVVPANTTTVVANCRDL